ncbi:MAG: VanZ family protein [Ruminococcus sp.]|nr:VanZ family protein [Ruminococcus sp.]
MLIAWALINRYLPGKLTKAFNYAAILSNVTAILFFTLTNHIVKTERPYRLIPFAHYFTSHSGIETLWLNAFFFLPLGLSMPYILPDKIRHKALVTIITGFAFSTMIEAIQ